MRGATPEDRLAASYGHCTRVARHEARNFYYGFLLLPSAKRVALCALYAFMRSVDDIADELGDLQEKSRRLAEQRAEMDRALRGEDGGNALWPAFRDTIHRYSIPERYLHDLISGAEMDQSIRRYETFESLREYCYRVAGTVGLTCLYVFGFQDPRAPQLAEKLGIAFQLTNILRDVPWDFAMGRVYLPQEDLRRFGCAMEDLQGGGFSEPWRALVQFEAERAWQLYVDAWPLLRLVSADSRPALWALARIYLGILQCIELRGYDIASPPPPRVSTAKKLWILARARIGWRGEDHGPRIRNRSGRRAGGSLVGDRAD